MSQKAQYGPKCLKCPKGSSQDRILPRKSQNISFLLIFWQANHGFKKEKKWPNKAKKNSTIFVVSLNVLFFFQGVQLMHDCHLIVSIGAGL